MGIGSRVLIALGLAVGAGAVGFTALADETSTGDKLRILYSNRFTFTDDGVPRVTVEIMSGQEEIRLSSSGGVVVEPDGDGGAAIDAGKRWSVRVEDARPARVRQWTVVERLEPGDDAGERAAIRRWRRRGYEPESFEIGTVFGVEGEVIDGRETLIAIEPVPAPGGRVRARQIAREHGVITTVHTEMVRRPSGAIVARSGDTVIRNPSVIWFSPRRGGDTLTIEDVIAGGGGSQLDTSREDRRYFGKVYVTVGRDGKLTIVNSVPADRLLAGLVPAEIYPSAPSDALRAQAVAARTELLQKIGSRHLADPYLLCSSQHCQVYSGAGREHPRTTAAVERTRGTVLLRDGGGLADTRYSAACGGHGEHNDHIWGGAPDPSLRGRLDGPSSSFSGGVGHDQVEEFLDEPAEAAYCGQTRFSEGRYRWEVRLKADEATRLVAAHYTGVGAVRALEPLERGVSGRISRLRIRGSKGTAIAEGDLHIRRLLGGLRSSLFVVEPRGPNGRPSAFDIRGAGFGHGVGMCQLGAIGMAEQGKSFPAILRHYYAGTRLQRLY